jgi:hypothetical protein
MRAFAEWTGDELVLVLEDVDLGSAERLGFVGGRRVFPCDAPYAAQAAARFEECAEAILAQLGDREPVPWGDALQLVVDRVGTTGWMLVGSAARALRGERVSPHDLDLVSDAAGAERIAAALSDLLVEPLLLDGGWIGARWWRAFGGARIEGVGEFAGEIEDLGSVDWRGREIRVGRVT